MPKWAVSLFAVAFLNPIVVPAAAQAATCVGADPCHACHTCEYCKRCAGRGLKCGVCKNGKETQSHRRRLQAMPMPPVAPKISPTI
jgi:hypothetical protein